VDKKGQANIASIVVGVAVAAVAAVIGISIFNTVNATLVNRQEGWANLFNLMPTIIAAILIIGAISVVLVVVR
jgi:high-affinity Fe2+/Pb2+ permease